MAAQCSAEAGMVQAGIPTGVPTPMPEDDGLAIVTRIRQCAPRMLLVLLEYIPCTHPISWQHALIQRSPQWAVPILCSSPPACPSAAWLPRALHAASATQHRASALRAAAKAEDEDEGHTVSLTGAFVPPPPPALQPQPPVPEAQDATDEVYCYGYRRTLMRGAEAAIKSNNIPALRTLLAHGMRPTSFSSSALWRAAKAGREDIVHLLLGLGAEPGAMGGLSLQASRHKGHWRILQALLAHTPTLRGGLWAELLVPCAGSDERPTLSVLLQYALQHQGDPDTDYTRANVGMWAGDALQTAADCGATGCLQDLLAFPTHGECPGWDHVDTWGAPDHAFQPSACPTCAQQARNSLPGGVQSGSAGVVAALLDVGVPPDSLLQHNIAAPLHTAAGYGYLHIVREIMGRGMGEADAAGTAAAAEEAARQGQVGILWELSQQWGVPLGGLDPQVLVQAAGKGHTQTVTLLLQAGVDPTVSQGEALVLAAKYSHLHTLRLLLGQASSTTGTDAPNSGGAAVDDQVPHPDAPRMITPQDAAALYTPLPGLMEAVSSQQGLPVVPADIRKSAALRIAAKRGHGEAVQLLLAGGAKPGAVANQALFTAMAGGYLPIVAALLETGQVVLGRDEHMMAVRSPCPTAMKALLAQHAGSTDLPQQQTAPTPAAIWV